MNDSNHELVSGYISIVSRSFPLLFIDWYFKSEDKPWRSCLHDALFEPVTDETRDLKSDEVRRAVVSCAEKHDELMRLIEADARELIDRVADEVMDETQDST